MVSPDQREPVLTVKFYRSPSGNEPVRDWLHQLDRSSRRTIGEDIKTAQYGWPLGMPLIRKLQTDLWEVRSTLAEGISRVFFTVDGNVMVLLHGIVKKSRKTSGRDLEIARHRLMSLKQG